MGCLKAYVTNLSNPINAVATRIDGISALVSLYESRLRCKATALLEPLRVVVKCSGIVFNVSEISDRISFTASVVCDVPSYYLIVESDDVVWLTESNGYSYDVEVRSNTNWRIE